MRVETFFEKFELFANSPDAVNRLRELVFELAATGRLLPELLERPVDDDLRRLGELAEFVMGQAPPGTECNTSGEGTLFVKVGEFGDLYPVKEAWTTRPLKHAKTGDVLICVVGATVGKLNLGIDCAIGRSVAAIRPSIALDTKFLYYSLMPYVLRLRKRSRGSAQGVIGRSELSAVELWIPSIGVQRQIVAKVDELMAICDRLEVQQKEREEKHATLARASLARFTEAPTPANLNYLFHPSYTITSADLRKTILTLAVQGRLVPQVPSDGNAADLVDRIVAQRPALAKLQQLRIPKSAAPVVGEDVPHNVPYTWTWCRLANLALSIDYGTSEKAHSDSSKVPAYRMGNISGGRLVSENLKYVDPEIPDLPALYLKTGDILFNRTNSYDLVGKSGLYTGPDDAATFASYLIRVRLPSNLLLPEYVAIAMNSPYFRQTQIEPEVVQQCGQANFNGSKLASTLIPIPPFAEQHRIVVKVDQLMALVDQLEEQLAKSHTLAERLMEAVVGELTRPTTQPQVSEGNLEVPQSASKRSQSDGKRSSVARSSGSANGCTDNFPAQACRPYLEGRK